MPRRLRNGGNDQHWVVHQHLDGAPHGRIGIAAEHIVHTQNVREEHAVEAPTFQRLCKLRPVAKLGIFAGAVARMPPPPGD